MAHNLEIKNGQASFIAYGEKAWHGLGTYVPNAMTAEEVITGAQLDYTVEKRPVHILAPDGTQIEVPGRKATVRTDTNTPLGVVSDAYHVIQNLEAFSFFDSIIERGEAIFHTAATLGAGENIFVTAKLPKDILVHGEQVENYLLLTTGHTGRDATRVGITPIRVVCNNTLQAALAHLKNSASIIHCKNAKQKLAAAAQVMGMASKYTAEVEKVFNKMAAVKITDKTLRSYIERVMNPSREVINAEEYSKIFTKTVDSVMEFALTHDTQLTEATSGTVWGAYNAVSGYFGYLKGYKSQEDKMQDLYFKGGAKRIEIAFEQASLLLN